MFEYFLAYARYRNLLGIFSVLAIAWAFSKNRRAINKRLVFNALILHAIIGAFVLKTSLGQTLIGGCARGIAALYQSADAGIVFLFGNLIDPAAPWGFIFAVRVLPIIVFFGAFMALLFHYGVVQRVVTGVSAVVQPLLGTRGAETLCAIANSFLGQTEAPLLIRHYLGRMTRSEIMLVMISGMGTMSGAILAVYASMGVPAVHLLSASVMAIPATIALAKILYPETEVSSADDAHAEVIAQSDSVLNAIAAGTTDGMYLALNVGAMLISFISLIALINTALASGCALISAVLAQAGSSVVVPCLSLQNILGVICAPIGWLMGFDGAELFALGELVGIKVAVNEMVAYTTMLGMSLSDRAVVLVTYALCGFSNFSCIGIQIGGIGALAPEKRSILAELGMRAVLGGALANLLSAFMAGLLL
jgi:concentrative nucleoside transporter, CNT family